MKPCGNRAEDQTGEEGTKIEKLSQETKTEKYSQENNVVGEPIPKIEELSQPDQPSASSAPGEAQDTNGVHTESTNGVEAELNNEAKPTELTNGTEVSSEADTKVIDDLSLPADDSMLQSMVQKIQMFVESRPTTIRRKWLAQHQESSDESETEESSCTKVKVEERKRRKQQLSSGGSNSSDFEESPLRKSLSPRSPNNYTHTKKKKKIKEEDSPLRRPAVHHYKTRNGRAKKKISYADVPEMSTSDTDFDSPKGLLRRRSKRSVRRAPLGQKD